MHTNTWNVVASVYPSLPRVFPVYSSSLSSSIIKPAEAAGTFAYLCQTSLQQFPVVTLTLHLLVTDSPLPLVAEFSSPPRARQVHSWVKTMTHLIFNFILWKYHLTKDISVVLVFPVPYIDPLSTPHYFSFPHRFLCWMHFPVHWPPHIPRKMYHCTTCPPSHVIWGGGDAGVSQGCIYLYPFPEVSVTIPFYPLLSANLPNFPPL